MGVYRDIPGILVDQYATVHVYSTELFFFFFYSCPDRNVVFSSTRQNKTEYVENDGAAGGPVIAAKLLSNIIGFLLRLSLTGAIPVIRSRHNFRFTVYLSRYARSMPMPLERILRRINTEKYLHYHVNYSRETMAHVYVRTPASMAVLCVLRPQKYFTKI